MKSENDFTPVLLTATRECGVRNVKKANQLLDAFLQWFSLIPLLQQGQKLQMIREIDPIWHSMILHTKFYRSFCRTYIGQFIDHDPTDVDIETSKTEYANFTLNLLEKTYGSAVNKYLYFLEEGATCCVGFCDDIGSGDDDGGIARTEFRKEGLLN